MYLDSQHRCVIVDVFLLIQPSEALFPNQMNLLSFAVVTLCMYYSEQENHIIYVRGKRITCFTS